MGQFDRLISNYIFPLPIYLQSHCMIVQSPESARVVFSHLRSALVQRGVVSLRPQVNAMDIPRGGRFRVWVDWHELAFPVEETRKSSAIYYCRESELGPQIEMVNYTLLSMPELNQRFATLAMSA
jgi:hypothetical protein